MDTAFAWAQGRGGLCPWSSYTYSSGSTGKAGSCKDSGCKTLGSPKGYTDVRKNDANALVTALNSQPVSVAVDATNWQNYKSGIYSANCGTSLNHGVLAVGYDSSMWKVKNSWASSWGEAGYIRLSRSAGGSSGQCGILMGPPSYPTY
jgi:KDEL-tailed cysteine endopeptidase